LSIFGPKAVNRPSFRGGISIIRRSATPRQIEFPCERRSSAFHRRVKSITMGINNRKKMCNATSPSSNPRPFAGGLGGVVQPNRLDDRKRGAHMGQLAHFEALLPH
jgi:hypothetical protein